MSRIVFRIFALLCFFVLASIGVLVILGANAAFPEELPPEVQQRIDHVAPPPEPAHPAPGVTLGNGATYVPGPIPNTGAPIAIGDHAQAGAVTAPDAPAPPPVDDDAKQRHGYSRADLRRIAELLSRHRVEMIEAMAPADHKPQCEKPDAQCDAVFGSYAAANVVRGSRLFIVGACAGLLVTDEHDVILWGDGTDIPKRGVSNFANLQGQICWHTDTGEEVACPRVEQCGIGPKLN